VASDPQFSYQHPETGEWAHDVRNPQREAREIFVEPLLKSRPPVAGETLRILEFGFGRGANTATTLELLRDLNLPIKLKCWGFEPFPEILEPWDVPPEWGIWPWWGKLPPTWQHISSSGLQAEGLIQAKTIQVAVTELIQANIKFDWIFCDLFSPARHAVDWGGDLAISLAMLSEKGSVLSTYCVARKWREELTAAGFKVERRRQKGGRDSLLASMP